MRQLLFPSFKYSYVGKNITAQGQEKKTVSIVSDEFGKMQAFLYLFPKGKFDYNAPRDIQISPARYFNQRMLNYGDQFSTLCIRYR